MSLTLIAAVAALSFASPQEAAQPATPAPAPAPERTPTPAEAEFEAKGEAFSARMQTMQPALEAAMSDPATDNAGKIAATDQIIAGYEPDIETFAGELDAFLRSQAALPENAANSAQMLQAADTAPAAIRGIPAQIRASIRASLEGQAATPEATPPAPQD